MSIDHLNSNIQNSCQDILNGVRSSCLNFALQETPFSLFLTIRKSYHKPRYDQNLPLPQIDQESLPRNQETPNDQFSQLQSKFKDLEKANENLKGLLECEVLENEHSKQTICALKNQIDHLHENIDKVVIEKVKTFAEEKRKLQIKHERICAESKSLKSDKENLEKELKHTNVALKSARKEIKDQSHDYQRKIEAFENRVKDLLEYKTSKASEEKDLRNKLKKVEKKLREVKEKEAELKLERNRLNRDKTLKSVEIKEHNNNVDDVKPKNEQKNKETNFLCLHIPQCALRQPKPPPIGPLTLKQLELT